LLSFFIARAVYDGAVTYRYITDAEVSDVTYYIVKSVCLYIAW